MWDQYCILTNNRKNWGEKERLSCMSWILVRSSPKLGWKRKTLLYVLNFGTVRNKILVKKKNTLCRNSRPRLAAGQPRITAQIFKKFSYGRLPILVKSIWVLFMGLPLCLLLINTYFSQDCQQHSLKKLLHEGLCLICSKY